MGKSIINICLLVYDYDEAIDFYVKTLNFVLKEDTPVSEKKRWVTVSPSDEGDCSIVLNKINNNQKSLVGNQAGEKVLFIVQTDDVDKDYQSFLEKGVSIIQKPTKLPHGKVMIIKDIYGNKIDFIEK
ncbi:VOC family protein [Mangrovivirga sp. M17]|uniref:VOC family protein n=1 Tax=Mangrovivirga halotolerans TaxID=2993936 RepID=A0ABT3RN85_9BACT|nr:VOC family protein [Mangrovivirga halotolerans]MCX2743052.1 VOC family protein [Mangrovivirga halotolerans]